MLGFNSCLPLSSCRPLFPPPPLPFVLLATVPIQGKLDEAEILFRTALVNLQAEFESYPLQVATIMFDLAGVLAKQV